MAKFPKYSKDILDKFGSKFGQENLAANMLTGVEALLNQYGDEIEKRLKKNLQDRGSNATRSLYQSIVSLPVESKGNRTTLTIQLNDYYKWVDEGRKAGKMPPKGVFEKWLLNKPQALQKFKSSSPKGRVNLKSLDFVIRRKIAREGTKGNDFFSDVYNNDLYNAINEDLIALTSDAIIINIVEQVNDNNK